MMDTLTILAVIALVVFVILYIVFMVWIITDTGNRLDRLLDIQNKLLKQ